MSDRNVIGWKCLFPEQSHRRGQSKATGEATKMATSAPRGIKYRIQWERLREKGLEETLLLLTSFLLEDTHRIEPDSSQRYTLIEEKTMHINWNRGNSTQVFGIFSLIVMMTKYCKRLSDVQHLTGHSWEQSDLLQTCSEQWIGRGDRQITLQSELFHDSLKLVCWMGKERHDWQHK